MHKASAPLIWTLSYNLFVWWGWLSRVCGAQRSISFQSPSHGDTFSGSAVEFRLHTDNGAVPPGTRICFCVQSIRKSYFSPTTCITDASQPYTLDGFAPGVWRAEGYLVPAEEPEFEKGCHLNTLGPSHVIDFVVDRERWYDDLSFDQDIGPHLDRLLALQVDHGPPADLMEDPLWGARLEQHKRLQAFDIVLSMAEDPLLEATLRRAVDGDMGVIVMMFNSGHLPMALNALHSLHQTGLVQHVVVFALDAGVHDTMARLGVASYQVPGVGKVCAERSEARDVFSAGFADIAVMKPAVILATVALGFPALWMDTDIVLFRDPRPLFDTSKTLNIQAPSNVLSHEGFYHPDAPSAEESAMFRVELCTGFYCTRSGPEAVRLWAYVLHTLATRPEDDITFGDQAATNTVLFEKAHHGLGNVTVRVLDLVDFPGGLVYFETDVVSQRALRGAPPPVLVHNNMVIGMAKKVQRFRETGLWFADAAAGNTGGQALQYLRRWLPHVDPIDGLSIRGVTVHHSTLHSVTTRPVEIHHHLNPTELAIAVLSLGDRPWFPALLDRFKQYATAVGADLIVVTGGVCEPQGRGSTAEDAARCAKGAKPRLVFELLGLYQRVLLLDDTVIVRRDCPDLFQLVPPEAVGACVEDWRVKSPDVSGAYMRMSCLKYGVEPVDDLWFNSGVLLVSQAQRALMEELPGEVDAVLLYEQGYVNAMRHRHNFTVHDLGYRFNFMGSFETSNAANRPFEARDAFMVHVTTGLALSADMRTQYINSILLQWSSSKL